MRRLKPVGAPMRLDVGVLSGQFTPTGSRLVYFESAGDTNASTTEVHSLDPSAPTIGGTTIGFATGDSVLAVYGMWADGQYIAFTNGPALIVSSTTARGAGARVANKVGDLTPHDEFAPPLDAFTADSSALLYFASDGLCAAPPSGGPGRRVAASAYATSGSRLVVGDQINANAMGLGLKRSAAARFRCCAVGVAQRAEP